MINLAEKLLETMLSELDLPSWPLGSEVSKAFSDTKGGLSFVRAIFGLEGMPDRILGLGVEIKECNLNNNKDSEYPCVKKLKEKRDKIAADIQANGFLFNWDVFDNFWDKLPGD